MENNRQNLTVYYLDQDNNNKSERLEIGLGNNTPSQIESILTRGLQFFCNSTHKSVVIPAHRITKITY